MKYLLDTNICIYIIKKKPKNVFEKFKQYRVGDIGISAITYSELAYGVANSHDIEKNTMALNEFLGPLEIIDFHAEVAPIYGLIRTHLNRTGKPVGPLDMLIAAHALHLGSILVTNNTDEFSRIPNLRIENWI